jgi:pseudaminic acid biosynthesis-associated methylase
MVPINPIELWSGDFGDEYISRNSSAQAQAASLRLLSRALRGHEPNSAIELGANVGRNLRSMQLLYPGISLAGVEINDRACRHLRDQGIETIQGSLLDIDIERDFDLVLVVEILIHIEPSLLPTAYEQIYNLSRRLILVAEYYSPQPVEVTYRGVDGALWKRDFAGEMLDRYSDLRLLDMGATYHRQNSGDDDLTWFLLSK